MKRCDHCGQILAPELAIPERRITPQLRVRGTIKQLLYAAVRERPHTAEELRNLLWANDPDVSVTRLYIHVHHLNHFLQRHGLAVRCNVYTHRYGLVVLEDDEVSNDSV